jgi:hypothetical protein
MSVVPFVDWRGVQHARVTADMEELPYAPLRMLIRLRRLVPDGSSLRIVGGVRGVATFFDVSAGWIKGHLALLVARGYVAATWADDGSCVITVLPPRQLCSAVDRTPPADQGAAAAPPRSLADHQRSAADQDAASLLGQQEAHNDESPRSAVDQCVFLESCHEQQQSLEVDSAARDHNQPEPARPAPQDRRAAAPATAAQLQRHNVAPAKIRQVLDACPGLTEADLLRELAVAEARPDAYSPLGLAISALEAHQRVLPHRAVRPRQPTKPAREPIPTAAYRDDPRFAVGDAQPGCAPPGDADDGLYARAVALLPEGHPLDLVALARELVRGPDDAAALRRWQQHGGAP